MHQLLFPDTAGLMIFLAEPSFDGAYGFSIHENDGTYTLTVKQISNWMEVIEQLEKDFPIQGFQEETPPEERELIAERNKKQRLPRKQAAAKMYKIESNTFNTSPELANQLIISGIDVIRSYKNPVQEKKIVYVNGDTLIMEGSSVVDGTRFTFYCRDTDSVYTKNVHEAYLDDKMTELKNMAEQIVNDTILNETELIKQLRILGN
ncbi:MAG: hypothetical protein PHT87_08075 [Bacteroidales bacterium]|nr:hypothetical protein [Bacteroidales bacterium]MDD4641745.1 hypothetical protein [Bacteroidales bacterium]